MAVFRFVRWIVAALLVVVALVLVARTVQAIRDPALAPWHRLAPDEPGVAEMDAMDWPGWLAAEDRVFAEVRAMSEALPPEDQLPENRYWPGSPMYAAGFPTDWNRSFTLMPDGAPKGAVVLLHGLTDSPYSLRHVGAFYRDRGYAVVGMRMPGHGTVPGGLAAADWRDWMAATRLGVRAARALAPEGPLDLVGYSNGGALAMAYTLDALADPGLARPDRVVLLSPMIGVTFFARFAGLAGWPALLPAFDRAAWFDLVTEYNPFKYNSFPVQGGRQSWRLTEELRRRLDEAAAAGRLAALPPILTFQSVADSTVSTPAVLSRLYDRLPANGSELVLYDVNRAAQLATMLRPGPRGLADRLLPPGPRAFRSVLIGADAAGGAVARIRETDGSERSEALGIPYPREIFSLSHIALPFPPSDALYGYAPDGRENFGISLGALVARGETGTLGISLDGLGRLSSNPFLADMLDRIGTFMAPVTADTGAVP
ncbi:alpha/beta hydrolase [Amaricoccus solimangrovi]|uniref:Alpha/beta hydrolase n=1 Tax=Amaricoccus solimangrovi TaxID=2589815 RepID=A0A501WQ63_9RHOB|nr:alpha/beta hydrolase [Amaricoccus solimangrovi]TPE49377.1 alpha/beta hydrolase [Amaricoccus solimangrovi]